VIASSQHTLYSYHQRLGTGRGGKEKPARKKRRKTSIRASRGEQSYSVLVSRRKRRGERSRGKRDKREKRGGEKKKEARRPACLAFAPRREREEGKFKKKGE